MIITSAHYTITLADDSDISSCVNLDAKTVKTKQSFAGTPMLVLKNYKKISTTNLFFKGCRFFCVCLAVLRRSC